MAGEKMTYLYMIIFLIVLGLIAFVGSKYDAGKEYTFDVKESVVLKGLWSIVVILVHIPVVYQNVIQDMIGSFAYIGVTFFFMISAFGLKYGVLYKKNYLKIFWKKRITRLVVPMFLVNVISLIYKKLQGESVFFFKSILKLNEWVGVLLLFNFVFWFVYFIAHIINKKNEMVQDTIICVLIIFCSLIDKVLNMDILVLWETESIGFVYGIIMAMFYTQIKKWMNYKWRQKMSVFMLFSLVIGCTYLKLKHYFFWGDYVLKIILGATIIIFILLLISKVYIGNKVSIFLGTISYEIYLIHTFCVAMLQNLCDKYNSGVFIWLTVIITIALSVGVYIVGKCLIKLINVIKVKCLIEKVD